MRCTGCVPCHSVWAHRHFRDQGLHDLVTVRHFNSQTGPVYDGAWITTGENPALSSHPRSSFIYWARNSYHTGRGWQLQTHVKASAAQPGVGWVLCEFSSLSEEKLTPTSGHTRMLCSACGCGGGGGACSVLAALPRPGRLSPQQATRAGATDSERWREAEAQQVLLGLPWLSPSQGL